MLITAAAAIALAGFALMLRNSSRQLRQSSRNIEEISTKLADLAEKQLQIARAQTDILAKQDAGNRLQFLLAHRPNLVIRKIHVARETRTQIVVMYTLANIGSTDAHIYETNITLIASPGPMSIPQIPEYDNLAKSSAEFVLEGGQNRQGVARSYSDKVGAVTLEQVNRNEASLFVIGYVKYKDDAGIVRELGFLRRYDPHLQRFKIVEDPDYEYSD